MDTCQQEKRRARHTTNVAAAAAARHLHPGGLPQCLIRNEGAVVEAILMTNQSARHEGGDSSRRLIRSRLWLSIRTVIAAVLAAARTKVVNDSTPLSCSGKHRVQDNTDCADTTAPTASSPREGGSASPPARRGRNPKLFGVDLLLDHTGQAHFIEMNGRPGFFGAQTHFPCLQQQQQEQQQEQRRRRRRRRQRPDLLPAPATSQSINYECFAKGVEELAIASALSSRRQPPPGWEPLLH